MSFLRDFLLFSLLKIDFDGLYFSRLKAYSYFSLKQRRHLQDHQWYLSQLPLSFNQDHLQVYLHPFTNPFLECPTPFNPQHHPFHLFRYLNQFISPLNHQLAHLQIIFAHLNHLQFQCHLLVFFSFHFSYSFFIFISVSTFSL